jgi:two-component system, LytTR family, response regulator
MLNLKHKYLIVNQKKKTKVPIAQIIMLEGNVNYTLLHFDNGKKKLLSHTLSYYQQQLLTENFIRVHRAFLVNQLHIVDYDLTSGKILMGNQCVVNISRRRLKNFSVIVGR